MSQREGESLFPRSVYPSGDLATLEQTSNIDTIAGLVFGTSAPIPLPRSPEQVAELKSAWLDEVKANPFGYLGMRTDAWLHQIGLTQDPIWIYHPVIDPNERGWHLAFPALDDAFGDYQDLFADQYNNGGILNRAWIYLLLAIPAAFLLLRRSPALMVVGGLALSAWTYQVGLFFGTMGSQYRFEFPVVASVILAVAVAVKALVDERRGRTASDPVSEGLAPPRPAALPTATGSG
jgi:hypothetical protein